MMVSSSSQYCNQADCILQFVLGKLHLSIKPDEEDVLKVRTKSQEFTNSDAFNFQELLFADLIMDLSYQVKEDLMAAGLVTIDDDEIAAIAISNHIQSGQLSPEFDKLCELHDSFGRVQALKKFQTKVEKIKWAISIFKGNFIKVSCMHACACVLVF